MPYIPSDEEMGEFITPGTYRVEITQAINTDKDGSPRKDKKGHDTIGFCVTIREGGGFEGEQVWDTLYFAPNLISRTKGILGAFGIDTSGGLSLNDPKILVGRQAKANIIVDEYEGKKKNKVNFFGGYHALDGAQQKKDDAIPF